jgi:hypothetical protein
MHQNSYHDALGHQQCHKIHMAQDPQFHEMELTCSTFYHHLGAFRHKNAKKETDIFLGAFYTVRDKKLSLNVFITRKKEKSVKKLGLTHLNQ